MHRQVGELGNAQALEDRPQLLLAVGEIAAGQHLAGYSPAAWGRQVVPLQGSQGQAQEGFGWAVAGGRIQVVDARGHG